MKMRVFMDRNPNRECDKTKKRDQLSADLLVRWARLELAQDYSHYPLKVACLPFHHHRFVCFGIAKVRQKN